MMDAGKAAMRAATRRIQSLEAEGAAIEEVAVALRSEGERLTARCAALEGEVSLPAQDGGSASVFCGAIWTEALTRLPQAEWERARNSSLTGSANEASHLNEEGAGKNSGPCISVAKSSNGGDSRQRELVAHNLELEECIGRLEVCAAWAEDWLAMLLDVVAGFEAQTQRNVSNVSPTDSWKPPVGAGEERKGMLRVDSNYFNQVSSPALDHHCSMMISSSKPKNVFYRVARPAPGLRLGTKSDAPSFTARAGVG